MSQRLIASIAVIVCCSATAGLSVARPNTDQNTSEPGSTSVQRTRVGAWDAGVAAQNGAWDAGTSSQNGASDANAAAQRSAWDAGGPSTAAQPRPEAGNW
jgi:hypothetical protein